MALRTVREQGNPDPIDTLVMVPYDELKRDCCRREDVRERLEEDSLAEAISENHAYISAVHWATHVFEGASDQHVAAALTGSGITASSLSPGVPPPTYNQEELDEAVIRPQIAKTELRRRGHSIDDIGAYQAGKKWPE